MLGESQLFDRAAARVYRPLRAFAATLLLMSALGAAPAQAETAASPMLGAPDEKWFGPDSYSGPDFRLFEGDRPIDEALFLLRVDATLPTYAVHSTTYEPLRATRNVSLLGGGAFWAGVGVLATGLVLRQANAGAATATEGYLLGGYLSLLGAALCEVGGGTWLASEAVATFVKPAERPFNVLEAWRAAQRYNQVNHDDPPLRIEFVRP
jgi:hypothetical protein